MSKGKSKNMSSSKELSGERKEIFMRLLVAIISGIILSVWKYLIIVFFVFNWFYVLFTGKRHRQVADLSEIWNTQWYIFQRYLIFVTNERPFPFNNLSKNMTKFGK